jgi:hypothetical protein
VLRFQRRKIGRVRVRATSFDVVNGKIVAGSRRLDDGEDAYRVLTVRDGLIADWQDCRTRRAAERFARVH